MRLRLLHTCFFLLLFSHGLVAQLNNGAPSQNMDDNSNRSTTESTKDLKETLKKEKNLESEEQKSKITEPVYRKKTSKWYNDQSEDWRQSVAFNKTDAEAWFNYYKSTRYSGADQHTLDQIVAGMNANVPNTFQTHYVNYINSKRDLSKGSELMKAYLLDPGRKEIYKELAVYFTLKGDKDNLENTLKKWNTIGDMPQSLKDYGYNLLNTVPQNAILITDGEYDTYPLWILQTVQGHRADVKILNIDLVQNQEYRNRICQSFSLNCSGYSDNKALFIQNLVAGNPAQTFYFSYTVNAAYLTGIESNLYNEGLAYRYNSNPGYNYIQRLRNNWELVYKTGYLDKPIQGNEQFTANRMQLLNLNYVASGLELYDIYMAGGEKEKADKLYLLLEKLAEDAGKKEVVKSYTGK